MCFSLQNYASEYQIPTIHNIALTEIDTLKNTMTSTQGANHNSVLTNHLLASTSNLMTAANVGFYNATAVTNATTQLATTMVTTYVPKISSIVTTASSLSDQAHKQNIITNAYDKSEQIVTVLLQNRILGQDPVTIELSGIKVRGSRVMADTVGTDYQASGLGIQVQGNMLDGIYGSTNEVLQVIMGNTENPFTWSYTNDVQIDSQIMGMSFKQTDGSDISVSNLASDREVKFYLPDSSITGYTINSSGIAYSAGYDPSAGITLTTYEGLAAEGKKKIDIDTSEGSSGLSLHIQLRITSIPDSSLPSSTTPTGQINFYLGKGYEASASSYEQKLEVSETNMVSGVDHTTYTMFLGSSGSG